MSVCPLCRDHVAQWVQVANLDAVTLAGFRTMLIPLANPDHAV